jgi:hypothetical protein
MLTRIALRIAAVEALKGRTQVGDNVLDSLIGAIDISADGALRTEEQKPFIAVYTDGGKAEDGLDGRNLHVSGPVDLTFEYGVTASMAETDPETGESVIIAGIPATDPALEFFLDLVGHQISSALTDPDGEWADIWKALAGNVMKVERKRTSDASNSTRVAAHQMTLTVGLMSDPIKGEPLRETGAMARFVAKALASGDAVLVKQAQAMQAAVAGLAPDWKLDQRRYGLSAAEAEAMQLTPQPGAGETITEVVIDDPADPA